MRANRQRDGMATRLIKGDGDALRNAWITSLAQGGGPLAPRYLIAPNLLIVNDLRRQATRSLGAWANLRALTIEQLAGRLAEPKLVAAGRRPLDGLARRVLIATLIRTLRLDYLAPLAGQDGLVTTLDALLADLEEAGFSRFPDLPAGCVAPPEKAGDLARVYDAFRAKIEPTRYTMLDVYEIATASAPEAATVLGAGSIALYGFSDLNRAQRRLLAALAASLNLDFYMPWRDAHCYAYTRELESFAREELDAECVTLDPDTSDTSDLGRLGARFYEEPDGDAEAASGDGSVRIVSAPDEVAEAREVVRDVLDAARRGVPFSEIAIVYAGEDQRALLVDELAAAGVAGSGDADGATIPVYVDGGLPARSRADGLLLERIWDAAVGRWRRAEVIQLCRLCRSGESADRSARWDDVTRRLSIVEGRRQWGRRLRALPSGSRFDEADRSAAADLLRFLSPLVSFRQAIDEREPVAEVFARAERVVMGMVPEGDARAAFLSRLHALVAETDIVQTLEPGDVPGVMRSIAEGLTYSTGRFRDGTAALVPVHRIRQLSFRHVVVCGMLEHRIPSVGRQDPLLLDDERRAINRHVGERRLPIKGERTPEQIYLFARTLAAARESVTLTFPRTERVGGRRRVPSHYVQHAAEALGARSVEELPCFERIAPGAPTGGADRWVSPRELAVERITIEADADRAWAMALGSSPEAWRVLARRASRLRALLAEASLTAHDGRLSAESAERIARSVNPLGGQVSPTRLETYAACPRRFLLRYVVKIEPLEEPGVLVRLDHRELGTLVHRVLQDAFESAQGDGLDRVREEDREVWIGHVTRALDTHAARLEAVGALPEPLFWSVDREAVRADLVRLLDAEIADESGYAPLAFEVRFGGRSRGGSPESSLSTDESVAVQAGETFLSLSGRIDRIDAGVKGLRVLDYKTGRARKPTDKDVLKGGEMLQLPVYLEAAAQILPDRASQGLEAFYYYVTAKGGFLRWGIQRGEYETLRPAFLATVEAIGRGIAGGLFFPNPFGRKTAEHCKYCDQAVYCGPIRGIQRLAERKSEDADRVDYETMKGTA